MLSNSSDSSIRIRAISKIVLIAVISFIGLNAQGSNQKSLDSRENQANIENNGLNNTYEIQVYASDAFDKNNDNSHQDNVYVEENLENKNPVFNNSLSSVLRKGQNALDYMLNKGRNCFSFVTTKLWDFCGILSDIFLPADYVPTTIGDYWAGYIPTGVILFFCFYPQGDLEGLLREVGTISTLHYYFSRYYYRKDKDNEDENS